MRLREVFHNLIKYLFLLPVIPVALVLPQVVAAEEAKNKKSDRPNILFIFSDDHATHAIGAYDGLYKTIDPTPNIDQLASEGMLFENSFCTNSICGPSRAVILTGKHSHRNGFMNNGNKFDGDQTTFPKLLQACGYQTALFGKWHLNYSPEGAGIDDWAVLDDQGKIVERGHHDLLLAQNGVYASLWRQQQRESTTGPA